ncbi:MAG: sigma-70 family RNA polymerase sigma factor [Acidimicrobiales bacterium]|nr:sigma-70 family RNA polymerase sigma factor [Acidimicrobiales bacterium]
MVRLYLRDIGRYPLLTKDDEVRLSKQVEAGRDAAERLGSVDDVDAREKARLRRAVRRGDAAHRQFVLANLRLVVSIAKRYQASGLPLLDLVQEGNLGLMHAVEKFDWRKGFKFSTYATWWIRQAITRGIANTGRTIRLPVHAGDVVAQVQKTRNRLEGELGRSPAFRELAAELELPESRIVEALRHAVEPVSLSEPIGEEGEMERGDLVEDESTPLPFDAVAATLLHGEVDTMLVGLDEREREVLRLRYGLDRGEPRTLEAVGDHFHLTRERVRQIEAKAMSKLRHPSHETTARDLLAV